MTTDDQRPQRSFRTTCALSAAPLVLRLALTVVFLWAGLGKFFAIDHIEPDGAQALAQMGAIHDADPQDGADVRRVYALALLLRNATNPDGRIDNENTGATLPPYWPPALGKGPAPVLIAYAVAATEVLSGLLLLVGLVTRLWAALLVGVMLGAMWLTQIGPAYQTGDLVLGFLPPYPPFDARWTTPLFQLLTLAASLALVLSGPGRASLDALIFRKRAPEQEEDDE